MKKIVYEGRIREGAVGTLTSETYKVIFDDQLHYAYLDPFPEINYSDDSYRKSVNASNDIEQYFNLHDSLSIAYLDLYKDLIKRGDVVLDIGCGGGALLDLMKGVASKTIAIEPNQGYRKSLEERGHTVFSSVEECVKIWENKVDFLVSNHVIEHVQNPTIFLSNAKSLLKSGGYGSVLTPNYNDILLKLHFEEFAPFFFRKVHPLYLTEESLKKICHSLDLEYVKPIFFHEFGMANMIYWLKSNKPCGQKIIGGIDKTADDLWRSYLVQTGQTKDFGIIFRKAV